MSKKQSSEEPNLLIKIGKYLTSKTFVRNLLFMAIFVIALIVAVNIWLRAYTNHGQKLELPDFTEMHIEDAKKIANERTFEIIVNDSTQIVGQPGGLIINQNPRPNSMVKENRKVYVTTTKYRADEIRLSSIPTLYGREFEQKQKELSHMQIECRIQDYKYDPGEPGYILEVYYRGKLIADKNGRLADVKIDKGSTLDFVISESSGLEIPVPKLKCKTFGAAKFMIEDGAKLNIGNVTSIGNVEDQNSAYIVSQNPAYGPDATIVIGQSIDVVISSDLPEDCNE